MARQLSVCMPSNRGLEASHRAIETALSFCEARDALLIVSDNSGDLEKCRYWRDRSPHLLFLADGPAIAGENAMAALRAVETPFLLPIGDDDELLAAPEMEPIDLAMLDASYIGVKPRVDIFLPDHGIIKSRTFGIESETPGLRVREYFQRGDGDNTGFYSVFRSRLYVALMEFFLTHHPTRGTFSDWQLALTLAALGKLKSDPSIIYRYNASAWATDEIIKANTCKAFLNAGLTADYEHYRLLLRGLDLFVFASRRQDGLAPEAIPPFLAGEVSDLLDFGLDQSILGLAGAQNAADGAALQIARRARVERNPSVKYLMSAGVLDHFVPGLKLRYINFLKAASSM